MTLGENICRLRTEKGMSQGDLADLLEVSRQSVSKWETGSSVPELDKLVKLSGLFGVGLDELVKGEKADPEPEQAAAPGEPRVVYVERRDPPYPRRKTVGLVLFGFALLMVLLCAVLGGLLAGVLFSLPLWACGVVCFVCPRRPGLWCCWTLFLLADVALRFLTGTAWGGFYTMLRQIVRNTAAGILAGVMTLLAIALVAWTVYTFRDRVRQPDRRFWMGTALLGLLLVLLCLPWSFTEWVRRVAVDGASLYSVSRFLQVVGLLQRWGQLFLTCVLLIRLLAVRRWTKQRQDP